MDDLISRAALLKECAECQKTDPHFEGRGWANHFISEAGEPSTEWYCVEDMIENAPAVDAAPVVRAKWIKSTDRDNRFHCSACGAVWGVSAMAMRYCPGCSAKMINCPLWDMYDERRRDNA